MDIRVEPLPRRMRITQTMQEDLLCDPVMAAKILLGIELDAFQRVRLRWMWWVPKLVDSSGFSSGKTICDWVFSQLRCLLINDHHLAAYYPVFETGKASYWQYYRSCRHPIFRAHLATVEEKEEIVRGAACWTAYFRNDSQVRMPAPSFMKAASTQASLRVNTLLVEEWTHIDAASTGIDDQLIGRCTRPCWNQHHPVWANHILLTAPAKTQMHPSYVRYRTHERATQNGDPDYHVFSFSYKDFSGLPLRHGAHAGKSFRDVYRVDSTIDMLKKKLDRAAFLGEGLGIWSKSGRGWYTEAALLALQEQGRQRHLVPEVRRVA